MGVDTTNIKVFSGFGVRPSLSVIEAYFNFRSWWTGRYAERSSAGYRSCGGPLQKGPLTLAEPALCRVIYHSDNTGIVGTQFSRPLLARDWREQGG